MVDLHNIQFRYKSTKPLFSQLNLQLSGGRIYGLLGKNGAGKTTLLKHISGLITPQQGQASVLGSNISERDPHILEDIYVIPEEF
ncbi:ATP-binding cassette domain-containing protein [Cesiribacter andamanensis]|uniref:Alpha-hemolysin translocation ATP-binding protein HlyB n=1 Tax=Cesiribacter andamanensis AMV16 TaxID=1279009 RepID=M7NRX3_9BACT|nr:ATP-binding cassette domain-containing protein [Cesiribacter andamanensis]EMR01229.1 Alpha-hemolysin translocation ATP-binding protein HlyB [Cesiribacter andamanensis AMV16]